MGDLYASVVSADGGVRAYHEFSKMRNTKKEMDLMDSLCGQFNEVTITKNIITDCSLRPPCQWAVLTDSFFENLRIRSLIFISRMTLLRLYHEACFSH